MTAAAPVGSEPSPVHCSTPHGVDMICSRRNYPNMGRERGGGREKEQKKWCVLSVFCLCACDESDLVLYKISFFQDQILFSDNFNSFK